jgi:hypothetical protein
MYNAILPHGLTKIKDRCNWNAASWTFSKQKTDVSYLEILKDDNNPIVSFVCQNTLYRYLYIYVDKLTHSDGMQRCTLFLHVHVWTLGLIFASAVTRNVKNNVSETSRI